MITCIRDCKDFITDRRFPRQLFPYAELLMYDLERDYLYSTYDGDTGKQ